MKRFLLGTVIAAIAGFVWGAVFWMSPLPNNAIHQSKSDALLGAELQLTLDDSGVYYLPGGGDPTGEDFQRRREFSVVRHRRNRVVASTHRLGTDHDGLRGGVLADCGADPCRCLQA